jgi:hypothetical protein
MHNRDITISIPCINTVPDTVGATTGGAGAFAYGTVIAGAIIDRLGLGGSAIPGGLQIQKGDRAMAASPFAFVWSSVGTTGVGNRISIDCVLQHGDSSGGGDMAFLSSGGAGVDATTRNYLSSVLTTDMAIWTAGFATAPPQVRSNFAEYSLDRAKRFIRPLTTVTRPGATTSTANSIAEFVMNVVQGVTLKEFTYAPPTTVTGTTASSS